jgi:hypothetical protein
MSKRLATRVQNTLADAGLEVQPSLTGTQNHATVRLLDPEHLPSARRILRTAGLTTRRLGDTILEVRTANPDDEETENPDFDTLVSSWRKFAEHSSDAGFRKARRIARDPGRDYIAAADQIAEVTLRLSRKSPQLRRLAKILRWASHHRKHKLIARILNALSEGPSTPKPTMRDPYESIRTPNTPNPAEDAQRARQYLIQQQQKDDPFPDELPADQKNPTTPSNPKPKTTDQMRQERERRLRSSRRAAEQDTRTTSAIQFLTNYVRTNHLPPDQVKQMSDISSKPYEAWKRNQPGLNDQAAAKIWATAATAVAGEQQSEDQKANDPSYHGNEDGVGDIAYPANTQPNREFKACKRMDLRRTAADLIRIAEQVMEEYAPTTHPEDISEKQIQKFLDENAPDVAASKVKSTLHRITHKGIPKRGEESSRRQHSASKRKASTAAAHRRSISTPYPKVPPYAGVATTT